MIDGFAKGDGDEIAVGIFEVGEEVEGWEVDGKDEGVSVERMDDDGRMELEKLGTSLGA